MRQLEYRADASHTLDVFPDAFPKKNTPSGYGTIKGDFGSYLLSKTGLRISQFM